MSIRLYDSAWVDVDGQDKPLQVAKDNRNLAAFNIGEFQYDIDGYPLPAGAKAPKITRIYSLEAAKEAGLHISYNRDYGMDV